jgi:hypothetical protein
VITADPEEVIVPAVAVKEAVVEVAGTVTDAGTVSLALLDDKDAVIPPACAALDSVTMHEVLAWEVRLESLHVKEERMIGPPG